MKKILSLIAVMACVVQIAAQNDSLVKNLIKDISETLNDTLKIIKCNELTKEYLNSDAIAAEKNTQKAIALATRIKYQRGLAGALYLSGMANIGLGKFETAIVRFNESAIHFRLLGDKRGESDCYNKIGTIKEDQGKYPEALQSYIKGLKMRELIADSIAIASSRANIGNIKLMTRSYDEALKDLLFSLGVFKRFNFKYGVAAVNQNVFVIYERQGRKFQARKFIEEALQINKELGNQMWIASNLQAMGSIYDSEGNREEALKNFKESLRINESIGYKMGAISASRLIGQIYIYQRKFDLASKYLLQSQQISEEVNSISNMKSNFELLSDVEMERRNFEKALFYFKKSVKLRDSIYNEKNTKQIAEQQAKYEFEKREAIAKVEQQTKEQVLKDELKIQKLTRNGFVVGFIIVLLAAGSFFIQRNKIKEEKKNSDHLRRTVEEKQNEIIDSITYAKRIQEAILPPQDFLKAYLPQSFLLYLPKDIVAGDFYWAELVDERLYLAVADSTGHGVPGAMVSVVCSSALSRSVKEFKLIDTGEILNKTRELVIETFQRSEKEVKDGMDISLVCIDKRNDRLTWSGANNSIYFMKGEEEVEEVKGDKQPIGNVDNPQPFTTHILEVKSGSQFYLTTDGFADQFGGPKGKKFMQKQFKSLIRMANNLSIEEQRVLFERSLIEWKGGIEQVDDITVFAFRMPLNGDLDVYLVTK